MADSLASVDFQGLFRTLPGAYLLLSPDGTILDNSDEHVAVSMLPREQAVGRYIFDAYPGDPQSQADLLASHEAVRRTLRVHVMPLLRYDIARPAAQGGGTEERYWQISHHPQLDAHGELRYILQASEDVTEAILAARHAAEVQRELNEATERNRFVLESLPTLVWTTQPDGTAEFFNARWTDFTGRSLADTLGWGWVADLHPDDVAPTTARWETARQQGSSYQAEYRMRRRDGSYRWHLATGVPRLGPDGQIQMWVGCNADIHEQKLMVTELLEANEQQALLSDQAYEQYQRAQQQRQILLDLFADAPAMISVVRGPDHRYEFANTRFKESVGQQDLVGKTVAEVFPEIVSQGIIAILDGVFRTGEPMVGNELLVQLAGPDGQLRDCYFNFFYQRFEENGQPAGITAYAYDVTELVRTRQALEQLRGRMSDAPTDSELAF
ncbi:PAS domain-containing protein [Hymenobacter terrestris]|uniref:histidine kinase n=1 Tax=Hymenobacter terrestris TaxID=2748310 RepID=A0ABX2Q3H2_9BACT|nr:PAS domain-containing protein [Hymenobacter terrestris]NVO85510.1 PAS domain-containing protein [Hymenobacter terrestris]